MSDTTDDPTTEPPHVDRMKAREIRCELRDATGDRRNDLLAELRHRQNTRRTEWGRVPTYFALSLTAFALSFNEDLADVEGLLLTLGGLLLVSAIGAGWLSVRAMHPEPSAPWWQRQAVPLLPGPERAADDAYALPEPGEDVGGSA